MTIDRTALPISENDLILEGAALYFAGRPSIRIELKQLNPEPEDLALSELKLTSLEDIANGKVAVDDPEAFRFELTPRPNVCGVKTKTIATLDIAVLRAVCGLALRDSGSPDGSQQEFRLATLSIPEALELLGAEPSGGEEDARLAVDTIMSYNNVYGKIGSVSCALVQLAGQEGDAVTIGCPCIRKLITAVLQEDAKVV